MKEIKKKYNKLNIQMQSVNMKGYNDAVAPVKKK
jgi:hypothetical protein